MRRVIAVALLFSASLVAAPTAQAQSGGTMSTFCTNFFNALFAGNDLQVTLNDDGFFVVDTRSEGSPVGSRRAELLALIDRELSGRENNCLNFIAVDAAVASPTTSTSASDMEALFSTGG